MVVVQAVTVNGQPSDRAASVHYADWEFQVQWQQTNEQSSSNGQGSSPIWILIILRGQDLGGDVANDDHDDGDDAQQVGEEDHAADR